MAISRKRQNRLQKLGTSQAMVGRTRGLKATRQMGPEAKKRVKTTLRTQT
jgi:hypothetical protein